MTTTDVISPDTSATASRPTDDVVVSVRNLTKRFKQYKSPASRLLEWLSLGYAKKHHLFTALEDISFTVKKGECFGIVGPNGSGKSTLLKILTGVLMPTAGSFEIHGRVMSLLELGTGFSPELTGRENLINSGRLLGLEPAATRERLGEIIAFAELEDSIDVPIKYYSTGMVVRLAFSLFAHVEPDLFIVDEALSVGDIGFSRKCFQRLDRMRESGCTLLFVSHDLSAVRKYSDHAMFLYHGRCAHLGSANAVTDIYLEAMSPGGKARGLARPGSPDENHGRATPAPSPAIGAVELQRQIPTAFANDFDAADFQLVDAARTGRVGTGAMRIVAFKTTDALDARRNAFCFGDQITLHILARAEQDIPLATASCQLVNRMGVVVWGTNHEMRSGQATAVTRGGWYHAVFDIKLDLAGDEYAIDIGWGDAAGEGHVFDRITSAATITVVPLEKMDFAGLVRLECQSRVMSEMP